jgi:hypothetical protein
MISKDDTENEKSDTPPGFNIRRRRSHEKSTSTQKNKMIKEISSQLLNNFEKNF